jgi:phage gp29-like protein
MRYANTPTIDPNVRKDVEDMLENIGSSAWGVFPMGTEIKLIESSKTDAFKVYDELANRINKEMSICILGQTMTTEDGGSRSQAEVHERTEDEVTSDDKAFMQHYINDSLLPLLANMGYPINGLTFEWDDKENMPLEKRAIIDESISRMGFKFKKEYIQSTYGVEVEDMPEPEPKPEFEDKKAQQINALYNS